MRAEHAADVRRRSARRCRRARRWPTTSREIIAGGARRRRRRAARSSRRGFGAATARVGRRCTARGRAGIALDAARCVAGLEVAIHNVRAVAEAGLDEDRLVDAARGADREAARRARAARRGLRARRPPSVSVDGRDGRVTARAAGVDEVVRRRRAAPGDARRRASCAASTRYYRRHRRPGHRRAGVRDRVDPAGRRDRRPRQSCGCRRPSGRCPASSASTGSPGRPT